MDKRPYPVFCLLGVFLLATCCSGIGTAPDAGYQKAMTIIQGDKGKQISVKTGDKFTSELKELATAGYGWYIDNLDKKQLELVSKKNRGNIRGRRLWLYGLFRAKKKGNTEKKDGFISCVGRQGGKNRTFFCKNCG